eukprot:TRINITY_DN76474_c0_g1_i1.p1 TRINITY_DN76474_c0_g1~~TRINITY_DN76474_c0_g1_i1.p1  ORF type:complete len:291 (+),score=82.17 TRINITY_DN76474_c0_g1_i1:19-891(+)
MVFTSMTCALRHGVAPPGSMPLRRLRHRRWLPATLLALALVLVPDSRPERQEEQSSTAFTGAGRYQQRPGRWRVSQGAETVELQKALTTTMEQLEAAEAMLKRAQAFKLAEKDELEAEVKTLRAQADAAKAELKASEPEPAEVLSVGDSSGSAESVGKASLSERLNWEKLQAMSNEERMAVFQEVGPAFTISLAMVGATYWSINLAILLTAYHESTGSWPKLEEIFTLADGGAAAGTLAGVLAIAALLKPLRLLAAALLTPWTAENILPKLPSWLQGPSLPDGQQDKQGK